MEVVNKATELGFWVFGGYVRDVIIRNETKFKDIYIGCTHEQSHLIPKFLDSLEGPVIKKYDTLNKMGYQHPVFSHVHRVLTFNTPKYIIDIIVFKSFRDFFEEPTEEICVSTDLFFLTKDGLFARHNLIEYIELTQKKKFKVISNNSRYDRRIEKMINKGWIQIMGNV